MWQRSLIPPRTSSKFSKYFRGKRSSFIHRQRVDEWCLRKRKFEIPSLYVQILNLNKWWQLINQVWPMPLEYKQICSTSFPVQRVLLVTWKDAGERGGWSKEGVKTGEWQSKRGIYLCSSTNHQRHRRDHFIALMFLAVIMGCSQLTQRTKYWILC